MLGLAPEESRILKKLSTPRGIQEFLDALPVNFEKKGETCMSPRRVLREKKAHCIEGAMLAAAAFWLRGERPLLMDFKTIENDEDHVIAVFKENGYWGAVSHTNHAILRYRDPVYESPRELAMSYFHEYYLFEDGRKTLRSYSEPFDLSQLGDTWITREDDLEDIAEALDASAHKDVIPTANVRRIRNASPLELKAGSLIEWKRSDPRT